MERVIEQKAVLQWYLEAGVDEAIGDAPIDRYSLPKNRVQLPADPRPASQTDAPPLSQPDPPPQRQPAALVARDAVASAATQFAARATTLDELRQAFADFDGCALKQTATNFVFADGNGDGALMFIGEAPGAEEDRQGVPFVGPAGRLLDRMLGAIGLVRQEDAYITNVLPWRPPGNRQPTDSEIAACMPFMKRHIELANPKILVFVGGTAAKTLLETNQGIMRLRGRWFNYDVQGRENPLPARAILHPAYLLRTPGQKREAWVDLMAIKKRLGELSSPHDTKD